MDILTFSEELTNQVIQNMMLKICEVAKKLANKISEERNVKEVTNLIMNETYQLEKKLDGD